MSVSYTHLDLKLYLDLVAVATVADIVPLVAENRILVRHGLGRLAHSRHTGCLLYTSMSSNRFRNSGRNCLRAASRIFSFMAA